VGKVTVADKHPSRKRRLSAQKVIKDVSEGDFVRLKGHRGVGLVERIDNDWAKVAWKNVEATYHPLVSLRRVRAGGSDFDRRVGK
jgi:hypothetical protein